MAHIKISSVNARQRQFFSALLLSGLFLLLGSTQLLAGSTPDKPSQEIPKGLWEVFHDVRHQIEPLPGESGGSSQSEQAFRAVNPGNHLAMQFDSHGLTIQRSGPDSPWHLNMQLMAYGQANALEPVSEASLESEGRRIAYHRGDITEWYINGNKGLEQGFTLNKEPEDFDPAQALLVSLKLEGNVKASMQDSGQALDFYDENNNKVFTYNKLKAFDAHGKTLPAELQLGDQSMVISVDVAEAIWPVTIDPLFSTETKVTGVDSDAAAGDEFGQSLALSGNTALIGAWADDDAGSNSGSAYVFTRVGTSWNCNAKLTASDASISDQFGYAVALSGDTAVIGAYADDDGGVNSGSAYLYVKPAGGWATGNETAKLTAFDAAASDRFGWSVAVDGDTALIGADVNDDGGADSGSAYFNRFECGFSGSVAANRSTMVAVPCDLGAFNTVDDVFGDNFNSIDYQWTWVVYRRNEAAEQYVLQGLSSPLVQGEGYWIYSQAGGYWDAGDGELTTFTQSGNCPSPKGCYEVTLTVPADAVSERYNMVGHPANITTDWASVRFLVNGILYTPFDADFNGYVTNTLWKYNGNGYDSFDDNTPGLEGHLNVYDGIWVKVNGAAFGKTVKMLIPHGNSLGSPPGPPGADNLLPVKPVLEKQPPLWAKLLDFFIPSTHADKPKWDQEWYVRLVAVAPAENLVDRNNVFGQLQDSVDDYDGHDLVELSAFSPPYLSLSFPHYEWGTNAASYTSDYHSVHTGDADQWLFEIKSDDPYRDVDLYWDGVYLLEGTWTQDNGKQTWSQSKQMDAGKLYGQMVLEDFDTGEQVEAITDGVVNHYSFNMDGLTVRTFRWILETKNGKSPKFGEFQASPPEQLVHPGKSPMQQIPKPGKPGG